MSASVSFWYFIIFFPTVEIFQKDERTENNKTVVFDREKKKLELDKISLSYLEL